MNYTKLEEIIQELQEKSFLAQDLLNELDQNIVKLQKEVWHYGN